MMMQALTPKKLPKIVHSTWDCVDSSSCHWLINCFDIQFFDWTSSEFWFPQIHPNRLRFWLLAGSTDLALCWLGKWCKKVNSQNQFTCISALLCWKWVMHILVIHSFGDKALLHTFVFDQSDISFPPPKLCVKNDGLGIPSTISLPHSTKKQTSSWMDMVALTCVICLPHQMESLPLFCCTVFSKQMIFGPKKNFWESAMKWAISLDRFGFISHHKSIVNHLRHLQCDFWCPPNPACTAQWRHSWNDKSHWFCVRKNHCFCSLSSVVHDSTSRHCSWWIWKTVLSLPTTESMTMAGWHSISGTSLQSHSKCLACRPNHHKICLRHCHWCAVQCPTTTLHMKMSKQWWKWCAFAKHSVCMRRARWLQLNQTVDFWAVQCTIQLSTTGCKSTSGGPGHHTTTLGPVCSSVSSSTIIESGHFQYTSIDSHHS